LDHSKFSSNGPTSDGRVKPDLCALGEKVMVYGLNGPYRGNGTSYATPIMAGGFVCLMQQHPQSTPDQLRDAVTRSGGLYSNPNNKMGYGVPDFYFANVILGDSTFNYERDFLFHPAYTNGFSYTFIRYYASKKQKMKIIFSIKKGEKIKRIKTFRKKLRARSFYSLDEVYNFFTSNEKDRRIREAKQLIIEIRTPSTTEKRQLGS
jgi:hypothetical protein